MNDEKAQLFTNPKERNRFLHRIVALNPEKILDIVLSNFDNGYCETIINEIVDLEKQRDERKNRNNIREKKKRKISELRHTNSAHQKRDVLHNFIGFYNTKILELNDVHVSLTAKSGTVRNQGRHSSNRERGNEISFDFPKNQEIKSLNITVPGPFVINHMIKFGIISEYLNGLDCSNWGNPHKELSEIGTISYETIEFLGKSVINPNTVFFVVGDGVKCFTSFMIHLFIRKRFHNLDLAHRIYSIDPEIRDLKAPVNNISLHNQELGEFLSDHSPIQTMENIVLILPHSHVTEKECLDLLNIYEKQNKYIVDLECCVEHDFSSSGYNLVEDKEFLTIYSKENRIRKFCKLSQ